MKEWFAGAGVSPTKIEWPTTYPRLAHDKQKAAQTHDTKPLEGSRPPLSHRYHSLHTRKLTHSGPSSAGRADEYCRSLAPTQSSLVLSTRRPAAPAATFPFPYIHTLVSPSTPLPGNCQHSSRPIASIASCYTPRNPPSNTPRSTVTMVSRSAVNIQLPKKHSLTTFF